MGTRAEKRWKISAWWDRLRLMGSSAQNEEEDGAAAPLLPPAASAAGASGAGAAPAVSSGSGAAAWLRRAISRPSLTSEHESDSWATIGHELGRILHLALPSCISVFFNVALGMVSTAFIGRLGKQDMAAAMLAMSFMNVTGFTLVIGFLGAMDTLCGQAWGAKNYPVLGLTLQKGLVTSLMTSGAVSLLWANMEWLLLAAGQQPAIAKGAARFMFLSIPALFIAALFECQRRYLMAQGIVIQGTFVSCVSFLLSPLYYWLFIFKAGLGLDGAVYAMLSSYLTMLCLLSGYVVWHEWRLRGTAQQTWHGWSRDCLKGLGTFFGLAIPATVMLCMEGWAYEALIIMTGWLPDPSLQVSVMGILVQVANMFIVLPAGLSLAASVRVSNGLGAGLPHAASRSAYTAIGLTGVCVATLATAITLLMGRGVCALFTNVPEVLAACGAIFPFVAGRWFLDGIVCVCGGVLRGAGRQLLGAWLFFGSYWLLGLPVAYVMAFKAGWGVAGMWTGLVVSIGVQGMVMLAVLARFNWQKEAQRAADLLAKAGATPSPPV